MGKRPLLLKMVTMPTVRTPSLPEQYQVFFVTCPLMSRLLRELRVSQSTREEKRDVPFLGHLFTELWQRVLAMLSLEIQSCLRSCHYHWLRVGHGKELLYICDSWCLLCAGTLRVRCKHALADPQP